MASFWDRLTRWLAPPPARTRSELKTPTPALTQDPVLRVAQGYPNTFPPTAVESPEAIQAQLFDPALQHYPCGFRLGEPAFASQELSQRWYGVRGQMIGHLLRLVSGSSLHNHLVLRGSLLMKAWLGDAAREPGDIDWVVTPKSLEMTDPAAQSMLDRLVRAVTDQPGTGDASIEVSRIATDDIWTYERAPGKRIVFPWTTPGLPGGSVQMDLVFGEELWTAPVVTPIPAEGGPVPTWAVTRDLALAWKLLWLESDMYPQGKDLYDAMLLAEQTPISYRLIEQVFEEGDCRPLHELSPDFPMQWEIDWASFRQEYPWVAGEAAEWQARLTAALAPTFAAPREPSG
jgi:hypothetical protein